MLTHHNHSSLYAKKIRYLFGRHIPFYIMISLLLLTLLNAAYAFSPSSPVQLQTSTSLNSHIDRRNFLSNSIIEIATAGCVLLPQSSWAADVDTEDFLKTGMVSMPMGVSGQAGKAKPRTGRSCVNRYCMWYISSMIYNVPKIFAFML